ncbi:MAG TPA: hypothetical protein VIO60_07890, partial [Rectinemataceae bacterium]
MSIFDDGSQTKEERRRTILAVVISTVIVGVGFTVQSILFPPVPAPATQTQAAPAAEAAIPPASTVLTTASGPAVA